MSQEYRRSNDPAVSQNQYIMDAYTKAMYQQQQSSMTRWNQINPPQNIGGENSLRGAIESLLQEVVRQKNLLVELTRRIEILERNMNTDVKELAQKLETY